MDEERATNRDDATQRTRAEVLRVVRNAGLFEVADELAGELPEVVDLERDHAIFERHGLDADELTSRMGGSP
jgi:hypothetical protein